MMRAKPLLLLSSCLLGLAACAGDTSQPFPRSSLADPEVPRAKPLDAPLPVAGSPTALSGAPARTASPAPELRFGSGTAGTATGAPAVATDPNGISLNFVDAEIGSVLSSVLGDLLNLTYAIDPRVQGRVTLRTAGPLARNAVLPALEAVLRTNGVALLRSGGLLQAVPADGARAGDAMVGRAREAGARTQIVPLRVASAVSLQKALEGLAGPSVAVRAEPESNSLILSGGGPEINSLLDTIALFDVDGMQGKSFGLFRLGRSEPHQLIDELDMIFQADPQQAALANSIRFVPVERLNAVLAITRQPDQLRQVTDWIARLDRPSDSSDPALHVYKVTSGRASYLAEVLSKLYPDYAVERAGKERGERDPGGSAPGGSGENPGGSAPEAGMITASLTGGPAGGPAPGGSSAATAPPAAGAAAPRPAGPAGPAPDERLSIGPRADRPAGGVRIVADTTSNALLVLARPAVFSQIEQTLRKLDVVPQQVMIEATIAEVRLNDALRFGVQHFINSGNFSARLTPFDTGLVAPQAPGFSFGWQAGDSRIILDALKSITDVSILSTPTLMVLDNRTAQLQVGDQVPTVTSQARSVLDSDAPIINEVTLKDTGVILSVTPRITSSGYVLLDVWQEVSDVRQTTSSNIDSPTFQRRRLESSVAVGDAETVALGGLIRSNRTRDRGGIPELSEAPLLGWLFGSRGESIDRTELLVLITPRIVRNAVEARAVTEELRERLSGRPVIRPSVFP